MFTCSEIIQWEQANGMLYDVLYLHGWTVPPRCARVEHPRNLAGTLCKAGNATRWKLSIYYNVDPFWDLVAIVAEV